MHVKIQLYITVIIYIGRMMKVSVQILFSFNKLVNIDSSSIKECQKRKQTEDRHSFVKILS